MCIDFIIDDTNTTRLHINYSLNANIAYGKVRANKLRTLGNESLEIRCSRYFNLLKKENVLSREDVKRKLFKENEKSANNTNQKFKTDAALTTSLAEQINVLKKPPRNEASH